MHFARFSDHVYAYRCSILHCTVGVVRGVEKLDLVLIYRAVEDDGRDCQLTTAAGDVVKRPA